MESQGYEESGGQPAVAVARGELLETDALKFLLSTKDVPEELKKNFWIWTDTKNLALSNMDREVANQFLQQFDFDTLVYFQKKKGDITYAETQWINQLRAHVKLSLLRSTGGSDRERKVIATSYRDTFGKYEEHLPDQQPQKTGIRARLGMK